MELCRRSFYSVRVIVSFSWIKRSGGSIFRAAASKARENVSAVRRLFSFAVVRQIILYLICQLFI